jgi:hypothetical protein
MAVAEGRASVEVGVSPGVGSGQGARVPVIGVRLIAPPPA